MSGSKFSGEALAGAIAEMDALTKDELRRRWAESFNAVVPSRASRAFLQRSLAHRLQEQALGGLTPRLRNRLIKLAGAVAREAGVTPTPSFKPGTRLIREWKGAIHEVEILEEGFAWRGHRYANLSRIAREITGTRWSGPLFFGLKTRPAGRADHGG